MKTFKTYACTLGVALLVASFFTVAEDNTDLIDAVDTKDATTVSVAFDQFRSCADMDTVLEKYLKKFKDQERYYPTYYMEDGMVEGDAEAAPAMDTATAGAKSESVSSSSIDFSQTNIQKKGVDEPEILKTDGNYIYYYNEQERKVYIMQSPLDRTSATITMDTAKVISTISIPDTMYGIQLFVYNNRLTVVATRNIPYTYDANKISWLNRYTRTSVALFDVTNVSKPKLLKFSDIDGYFTNARRIGNKLYVFSQLRIDRWNIYQMKENTTTSFQGNLTPKTIDVVKNSNGNDISIVTPNCNKISYLFPDDDTLENLNLYPEFTIVSVFNIDEASQAPTMNVLLTQMGEIHMSKDSLYITQNIWFPGRRSCPRGARCMMPWFDDGQQTLIHKFALEGFDIHYTASNIIPGSPLTQYSMDEYNGFFRILTRKNRSDGTNLYVLDANLEKKGSITGIEPGEEFKASRYIGNKLYLVTYEQTDPLFVIDLADATNPKIIGELKIPGFSTYLHPLRTEGSVQYIFGLGYDTALSQRGGTVTAGIKLDVYKVDYANKETVASRCGSLEANSGAYTICLADIDTNRIRVSQVATKTLGDIGSVSDVLYNPRLYVMDDEYNVTLPMTLQKEIKEGQRCDVYKDINGKETTTNCYDIVHSETTFAGMKSFALGNTSIKETASFDYLPLRRTIYPTADQYYYMDQRQIQNSQMRVGYAGDALYMINNDFSHFVLPADTKKEKYVYFDTNL